MKNKRKAILLVGALLCLNLNIFSQNIPAHPINQGENSLIL